MSVTEVENFFPQEILDKILSIAKTNNNKFIDVPYSIKGGNRKKLDLCDFDISQDIKQFCNSAIKAVDNHPIILTCAYLWKDEPGFSMEKHVDNYGVHIAIQIYLNDNDNLGTIFEIGDSDKVIKYGSNRGYILYNYLKPRLVHSVPKCNYQRLSLYIVYNKTDKDGYPIVLENEQRKKHIK